MKRALRWGSAGIVAGLLVSSLLQVPVALANMGAQGGELGSGADPFKVIVVNADKNNVLPAGTVIFGIKITSTGSGATCGWYDLAAITSTTGVGGSQAGSGAGALSSSSTVVVIDELYENTTLTTDLQLWPKPYKLKNGLSIAAGSAICTTYYY